MAHKHSIVAHIRHIFISLAQEHWMVWSGKVVFALLQARGEETRVRTPSFLTYVFLSQFLNFRSRRRSAAAPSATERKAVRIRITLPVLFGYISIHPSA